LSMLGTNSQLVPWGYPSFVAHELAMASCIHAWCNQNVVCSIDTSV
jgi:hypothetical protein